MIPMVYVTVALEVATAREFNCMLAFLISIVITSNIYSYNSMDFYENDGCLYQTGRFHGNSVMQMGDEFTCYGAHNINAELLAGDCNCDNNISIADMVVLNKFCVFGTSISRWGNADINYDGNVDKYDCESLQSALINKG